MGPSRILVSNDDGISAPGIVALVAALGSTGSCDVYVSAPRHESSASSHAITLGQHLTAAPVKMQGATEAYAIDGRPADCTMLALHGPLFQSQDFDLVVSGINRGDNLGLHVIYSGTVGAAEEAAIKGVPAIAVSLDNYKALTPEGFMAGATYVVALIQALYPSNGDPKLQLSHLAHVVVNINIPAQDPFQGFYLAHQGSGIVDLNFQQVTPDTPDKKEGHFMETAGNEREAKTPQDAPQAGGMRTFRNFAGAVCWDETPGSDSWAVQQGWVSVTPLGLKGDITAHSQGLSTTSLRPNPEVVSTLSAAVKAAAHSLGVSVGASPKL
ncbi:hypothetical protein ABBQ38_007403 [Trebouxia sp. C0009 RCD-2024]